MGFLMNIKRFYRFFPNYAYKHFYLFISLLNVNITGIMSKNVTHYVKKRTKENFAIDSISRKIISERIVLVLALAVFAIGSITSGSLAYASDHQNGLDAITDIEFRSVTDFHTYLPGSQISFNVSCNQLAGEFAIGFNTFIQKSDGSPADVNDVRNLVFLQRGSSDLGALIDAVNTGPDRLKLTAVVSCAKLLPVSLPTVPDTPTEFSVVTGDEQATLTWEAPLFDGGSPITKYQVSAIPDPRTAAVGDVFAETVDTSFTFDGLVNGITYKFRVNAVNDVGPGIISEIIIGTPLPTSTPQSYPTLTTYPTPDPTGKTAVCHNDTVTLFLPGQAIRAHLENHHDYLGECPDGTSTSPTYPTPPIYQTTYPAPAPTSTPDPTGKTAVCHNDTVTLFLPGQAVDAHLANHDDYLGECSDHTSAPQETSKNVVKQQDLEAKKLQQESDRLAKQKAKQLQLEAEKAQRQADRLAKLEADKAQRESDRLAKQEAKQLQLEADRLAKQEAKKLQLESDRLAKLEADKLQRQADQIAKLEAKKLQQEADNAERESILEAKKAQNNSEKSDKKSKLPPLGPK